MIGWHHIEISGCSTSTGGLCLIHLMLLTSYTFSWNPTTAPPSHTAQSQRLQSQTNSNQVRPQPTCLSDCLSVWPHVVEGHFHWSHLCTTGWTNSSSTLKPFLLNWIQVGWSLSLQPTVCIRFLNSWERWGGINENENKSDNHTDVTQSLWGSKRESPWEFLRTRTRVCLCVKPIFWPVGLINRGRGGLTG